MKSNFNSVYNIVCWLWLAVLFLGLNVTMSFIGPALLLFAIVFFCLADLVLGRLSILVKVLASMLMIHRTFYVGSFLNSRWLSWLGADLNRDLSVIFQQGWMAPSPILRMVLTLLLLIGFQSLYFSFISRRRGAMILLFAGTSLLTSASLWNEQGPTWYVVLYVIIGLVIMSTTRLQTRVTIPMQRWLSITLVWVLCITSIAWVLPARALDLGDWYGKVQTAWERLLEERGNDSVAVPRRVGYGTYDQELGGPLENDFTHVMTVTSPRPVYLAGESRIIYTGRGWQPELKSFVKTDGLPDFSPANIDGQEVEISVQMVVGHGRMLFVPRYVLEFQFSGSNYVMAMRTSGEIPHGDGDFEFRSQTPLQSGDIYTMKVLLPHDDPHELRQASNWYQGLHDLRYLQLHSGVPRRVRDLALDVTADADNGYDKAMALVDYLGSGKWRYSLETDCTPPEQDFVDWFLFEQDRGYCAHFSTAFVVMARAAGLPARWVKGFSSGVSDGQGNYRVTNSHAHSWAEVWFDDYGWVPFEPTPGSSLNPGPIPTPDPNRPDSPVTPVEPENPAPDPGQGNINPPDPGKSSGIQGYLVAILLVAVAGVATVIFRPSRKSRCLAVAYAKLQSRLRLFGWHRHWWETPREHLNRVASLPDHPVLAEFVQHFEESVYGGSEIGDPLELKNMGKRFSVLRLAVHRFSFSLRR